MTKILINLELSQQLSKTIRAKAKQCFNNAYRAIQDVYPYAHYVEGFVVTTNGPLAVEHAWLEVNGEIVDPTFCNLSLPLSKADQFEYEGVKQKRSEPTLAKVYLPVLRLTVLEVDQFARRTGQTHFMWFQFDEDIFTDEQRQRYKEAQEAAWNISSSEE